VLLPLTSAVVRYQQSWHGHIWRIFCGLSSVERPASVLDNVIRYEGRRDNIAIRQAAMIALIFNLFMVIVAIITIMKTEAKSEEKKGLMF